MSTIPVIWALDPSDVEAAGGVLGHAFADEPVFAAVVSSEDESLALCTETFNSNVRHALEFGEVWAIGPQLGDIVGVAYTVLKPEPSLSDEQAGAFGFTALMDRWGAQLNTIGALESEAVAALGKMPSSWRYLAGIGVLPEHQGSGLGSALVRFLVDRTRVAGEPFALITDRAANVPFYERAGFVTVGEGDATVNGLHYWSMVLEP